MQKGKIGGRSAFTFGLFIYQTSGYLALSVCLLWTQKQMTVKETPHPKACSNVAKTEQDGKCSTPLTVTCGSVEYFFSCLCTDTLERRFMYVSLCVCMCVYMRVHTQAYLFSFIQLVLKFNRVPCYVHGKAYWSTEFFTSIWVVLILCRLI